MCDGLDSMFLSYLYDVALNELKDVMQMLLSCYISMHLLIAEQTVHCMIRQYGNIQVSLVSV